MSAFVIKGQNMNLKGKNNLKFEALPINTENS